MNISAKSFDEWARASEREKEKSRQGRGRGVTCVCWQAEHGSVVSQMADPSREEEQVTLLGEEGLRAGGQALKLG